MQTINFDEQKKVLTQIYQKYWKPEH